MEQASTPPIKFFKSPQAWEQYLASYYGNVLGVWLKFAKRTLGIASVTYDEALDIALCYGWIDGQVRSLDDTYYLQKFTPRRAKSLWSKRNIAKAEKLIATGDMQPPGLAEVAAAQKDGRWQQAYDPPATMAMPADFKAALAKHPKAEAFFATLNKTNTYAVLWRIQTARKPETRQARINKLITMLNEGKKLHP
jgi:uncharacterized protein YdeI (YjbR/CyaY-like superfamily)